MRRARDDRGLSLTRVLCLVMVLILIRIGVSAGALPDVAAKESATPAKELATAAKGASSSSSVLVTVPAPLPVGTAATVNLLTDPSFEDGSTLADGWLNESTTVAQPTFSLSAGTGVVDGDRCQRMQYTGRPDDDGANKAQFFQGPVRGVEPGQKVRFSVYVTAGQSSATSMKDAYAIIGVESFETDGTYISDVATNITAVSTDPTAYSQEYTVPEGASYLAVFVQAPEVMPTSAVDLCFDAAALVLL